MPDYPAMYRKLLIAQADAVDGLKIILENLIKAHLQVEEMYVNADQPNIIILECEENRTELSD